jgi:hypothetical protein
MEEYIIRCWIDGNHFFDICDGQETIYSSVREAEYWAERVMCGGDWEIVPHSAMIGNHMETIERPRNYRNN